MRRAGAALFLTVILAAAAFVPAGCRPRESGKAAVTPAPEEPDAVARAKMVETQIAARGVRNPRVLAAMREVPRHLFVDDSQRSRAYDDGPLPIGGRQTISQPYIVALMSELLDLTPNERVLEIGTGSGYQSAVLSRLAGHVYSIEIIPELAKQSAERLQRLGFTNITVREGDGYRGWPEHAPFDGIIVTAAPERIPQPLLDQLAPNGRMVIPVGGFFQELKVFKKDANGRITEQDIIPVRFVPMTGEIEKTPSPAEN
ncbi:MAG TPA: protein-L-isoaspartate(D-aspartate) O-methyltransferase [Thermoanaerobaculia bacterium]|nr:protein-L-isoaspartate(D-aspartate) O-methyltransferase [Thermoanaerobaculia bacterium]